MPASPTGAVPNKRPARRATAPHGNAKRGKPRQLPEQATDADGIGRRAGAWGRAGMKGRGPGVLEGHLHKYTHKHDRSGRKPRAIGSYACA